MTVIGPGTKVKCIKEGPWRIIGPPPHYEVFPKFGEICEVKAGGNGFELSGYPHKNNYHESNFRPLDGIDDLAELIRHASNPDTPAKVPSLPEPEYVAVRP